MNKEDAQLLACSYSSKGDQAVVSGSDGKLYVYDEGLGKRTMVMEPRYVAIKHSIFN